MPMPFAFVFENQPRCVVETIGLMYEEIKQKLDKDGGVADSWDVFRRKINSARMIVKIFLENELTKSNHKIMTSVVDAIVHRWVKLETHLETVLTNKHTLEQVELEVVNYYSNGGIDHVRRQKRKRMASTSTRAMHAKPVEASAALQPTTSNKRRKIKSSAKHPCKTA